MQDEQIIKFVKHQQSKIITMILLNCFFNHMDINKLKLAQCIIFEILILHFMIIHYKNHYFIVHLNKRIFYPYVLGKILLYNGLDKIWQDHDGIDALLCAETREMKKFLKLAK